MKQKIMVNNLYTIKINSKIFQRCMHNYFHVVVHQFALAILPTENNNGKILVIKNNKKFKITILINRFCFSINVG